MSTPATQPADPELERAAWDLEPLLDGEGESGVGRRLEEALTRARAFAERHAGKLGELDGAGLAEAMSELAVIYELVGRAGTYAGLRFSTDTSDPANGALLQMVQERETAIETTLLFFELEWAALPEERAEELLAHPGLDFCRHHLRNVRRYREHLLSEPEEKILSEKSLTGSTAWARLFEELTSAIEVELPPPARSQRPTRRSRRWPGRGGDRTRGPRRGTQPPGAARPRGSSHRGGGGHRGARPGSAHARVRAQHAAGRQGRGRSAAPLPQLARGSQSCQRGQ